MATPSLTIWCPSYLNILCRENTDERIKGLYGEVNLPLKVVKDDGNCGPCETRLGVAWLTNSTAVGSSNVAVFINFRVHGGEGLLT